MQSHYHAYLSEKTDTQMIETEKGFCTWRWLDDGCPYIVDIFVLPEFRHSHEASKMADSVAATGKTRGAKYMYGSVNIGTKQCTESLKVLLAYGFELYSSTAANFLLLRKEI